MLSCFRLSDKKSVASLWKEEIVFDIFLERFLKAAAAFSVILKKYKQ
jgi:hypothetical protein